MGRIYIHYTAMWLKD